MFLCPIFFYIHVYLLHFSEPNENEKGVEVKVKPITIVHLRIPGLIMGVGVAISIVVFFLEFAAFKLIAKR